MVVNDQFVVAAHAIHVHQHIKCAVDDDPIVAESALNEQPAIEVDGVAVDGHGRAGYDDGRRIGAVGKSLHGDIRRVAGTSSDGDDVVGAGAADVVQVRVLADVGVNAELIEGRLLANELDGVAFVSAAEALGVSHDFAVEARDKYLAISANQEARRSTLGKRTTSSSSARRQRAADTRILDPWRRRFGRLL